VTAAIVLVVTAAAALLVRTHLLDATQARFATRAAGVTADLQRELVACSQVMRGASGMIASGQLASGAPLQPTPGIATSHALPSTTANPACAQLAMRNSGKTDSRRDRARRSRIWC
jgi:hypothetical protein